MERLAYEYPKLDVYEMEVQDVVRTSQAVETFGDLILEGYSSDMWN